MTDHPTESKLLAMFRLLDNAALAGILRTSGGYSTSNTHAVIAARYSLMVLAERLGKQEFDAVVAGALA